MECSPPSSCPFDFPGKNTGGGSHFLFQRIFLTQGQTRFSCIAGRFFTTESPGKFYLLGIQLALSNSVYPSFHSWEFGSRKLLALPQKFCVFWTPSHHPYNSPDISLKFTRCCHSFKKQWSWRKKREEIVAELSLDFISMTKIYSRCSYWILLTFLWPRQGHMAILNYWGFWENKYLTFTFPFFRCRPFLKSLLNWLQHCSCLMFFGPKACGILVPRQGWNSPLSGW